MKNKTTWQPGQSGNPNGRGKDKLFRQALMMELKEAGEDLPELRKIARSLIDTAKDPLKENWSFACREVIDRIDGKAPVMVTGDAEEFRRAVDMSDDELAEIIAIERAERGRDAGAPKARSSKLN